MIEHDPWGPIDISTWKEILFLSGRLADELDVKEGRAVFCLQLSGGVEAFPYKMSLPACALLYDEEAESRIPVIVIQAEVADDCVTVGYRHLTGGNGVCLLDELEILDGPTNEFINSLSGA